VYNCAVFLLSQVVGCEDRLLNIIQLLWFCSVILVIWLSLAEVASAVFASVLNLGLCTMYRAAQTFAINIYIHIKRWWVNYFQ